MHHLRILCLIGLITGISSGNCHAQTIPVNRVTDWSTAGLLTEIPEPGNNINFLTAGGIADGTTPNNTIFNAILSTLGGTPSVIYFPPGNFYFTGTLNLPSNLILRGAGSDSTTLAFSHASAGDLIITSGSRTAINSLLSVDAVRGLYQIVLSDASTFAAGNDIYIIDNDDDKVTSDWALGTTGQVCRIASKSGNTLTLSSPLRRSFSVSKSAKAWKLALKENVGIEKLKILRKDSTAGQSSNIVFQYAKNSFIRCVESAKTNFAHIDIRYSTNLEVSGCYIHDSYGYGGGGRAYGTMVQSGSGECLLENNIYNHLRHSMILQSGANGNVYAYNYSRDPFWEESLLPANSSGDMVLHGNYTYLNLFEGNIGQNIVIDNSHGKNGPFNTFFRNRAELYGFFMNTGPASDSQNVVGNEITNTSFPYGGVTFAGNGHFKFGNNKQGNIIPSGTSNLPEASLFLESSPAYLSGYHWPPIGVPNTINSYSIAAKDRWPASIKTYCNDGTSPVDCVVSDWSAWSTCTVTCGGGTQTRTRTVITPAQNGGVVCPVLTETRACNTSLCPIDCVVSDWSAWSTCTVTCGGGTQTRTRTVITPAQHGGAACPVLTETRTCNTNPCPVDCVVSDWSAWSACTVTCGGGTQTRTRTVITQAQHGGAACPVLTETRTCNTNPCPVDCVVSDWSAWSVCSAECGGGTQSRTRTVITPPQNGGTACPGLTESRACNEQAPYLYYRDADNDTYGNLLITTSVCASTPPAGYVSNNTDCDDANPGKYPGATEIPDNGIDEDCSGSDLVTAVPSILSEFGLNIYPNPAQNFLDISGKVTEVFQLNIYNLDGKLLIEQRLLPGNNFRIDISSLQAGTFILELNSLASAKRAYLKLVVIR